MAQFDGKAPIERLVRGYLDDPLGTLLRTVDSGQRVPQTKTQTSYSLTIHAQVGNRRGVIGAVHEVALQQNLQLEEVWEVDSLATGVPRELVPQTLTTRSLRLSRYELYAATIEQVFGTPELLMLTDQTGPISIRLSWKPPAEAGLALTLPRVQPHLRVYEFVGGYITDLGKTASMNTIIVGSNATFVWRRIRALQ